VIYTVKGKGGLIREVALDKNLSDTLEKYRLDSPRNVTDRGIFIEQYYDLGGGKKWSDSFSKAAQRELGWSSGAHGVRHTFAQARMLKLQSIGYGYEQALGIVSQEMGHFRPSITEVYLR
jgi:integrase